MLYLGIAIGVVGTLVTLFTIGYLMEYGLHLPGRRLTITGVSITPT